MDRKFKVLLVDDEPEILDLYTIKLETAGMEVLRASNGGESLKVAAEKKPDLIIMDVKMPIMNGIDAFARLKENPETKDIPVVFLTAFSDLEMPEVDVKYAKEVGAADFIRKGMNLDQFVAKVKEHLEKK